MTAFPVVDVALEGLRLTWERPRTVLVWGGVLALAQAATTALLAASGAGEGVAALARAAVPPVDPAATEAALQAAAPGVLLSGSVGLLADTVVYASVLRAVLRPAEARGAYLRLGPDELRLLAVVAALAVAGGVGALLLVAALATLIAPVAMAAGYAVSAVTPLVLALAVAALSYPAVRLQLVPAATLAERRARPFGGWELTRGVFWPLMGALLLAGGLAAAVLVSVEVLATCLWALGSGVDLDAASRALQPGVESLAAAATPGSIVSVLVGGVAGAFALVVAVAPGAAAYRALSVRRG